MLLLPISNSHGRNRCPRTRHDRRKCLVSLGCRVPYLVDLEQQIARIWIARRRTSMPDVLQSQVSPHVGATPNPFSAFIQEASKVGTSALSLMNSNRWK